VGVGVPVIDLQGDGVADAVDGACREHGFFAVVGHGIDQGLLDALLRTSAEFFALDDAEKAEIAMARGGPAWRGWFPLGGELTSGVPDRKEGIYFGEEGPATDPRPLHGPNLFPERPAGLRDAVLGALDAFTGLGHRLMGELATGLGLDRDWFARELTTDPTILFRIFHYPPGGDDRWGVAEHTDYGLLTMLLQDDSGGLQVRTEEGWIDVPPVPGALVCNIGDMLERLTGGRYRSTPHRVRSPEHDGRISCPFFFDPGWDAEVGPLPLEGDVPEGYGERWDGASLDQVEGTYGEYLLAKVAKVFPALFEDVVEG
jgi:isopenicillin N synthase-like dioxygenase